MSFNAFRLDCEKGLSKSIRSRKLQKEISIEKFEIYSKTYFSYLPSEGNFKFTFKSKDLEDLTFILRYHYRLWIEIWNNQIEIFENFPKIFSVIKDVKKLNHPHIPKEFKEGTVVYLVNDNYSTCNWHKGIPVWDNLNHDKKNEIKPSCQINYQYLMRNGH